MNTIRSARGSKQNKRRVGRGLGSRGTTAGRGQKGQTSRSGVGGLKRLGMRHTVLATPKLRGFRSLATKPQTVDIGQIGKIYIAGETVSPTTLAKKGLVPDRKAAVKILSTGTIDIAVSVKHCAVSAPAAAKITAAGGTIL